MILDKHSGGPETRSGGNVPYWYSYRITDSPTTRTLVTAVNVQCQLEAALHLPMLELEAWAATRTATFCRFINDLSSLSAWASVGSCVITTPVPPCTRHCDLPSFISFVRCEHARHRSGILHGLGSYCAETQRFRADLGDRQHLHPSDE